MAASVRCSPWLALAHRYQLRTLSRVAVSKCLHTTSRQLSWHCSGHSVTQLNLVAVKHRTAVPHRYFSAPSSTSRRSAVIYVAAVIVGMVGATYAAVPLYRLYCQVTGLGGQSTQAAVSAGEKIENLKKVEERVIEVRFNADTNASMMWNFKPQQSVVKLVPGETALAFYKAKNPTDKPITGISTYSVVPFEAGQYFNKIQCFCFEEQRLNAHEEVDMPVFFYIDPEFAEDPRLVGIDSITLSYTFFEVKDGMQLPSPPEYARAVH